LSFERPVASTFSLAATPISGHFQLHNIGFRQNSFAIFAIDAAAAIHFNSQAAPAFTFIAAAIDGFIDDFRQITAATGRQEAAGHGFRFGSDFLFSSAATRNVGQPEEFRFQPPLPRPRQPFGCAAGCHEPAFRRRLTCFLAS